MQVSLIIPTLNEAHNIAGVLKDIPKDIIDQILIVDGYSTDGTPDIAKKMGYKVIFQEGKGYGRAVATGLKYATGDTIVLIDADGGYVLSDIPKLLQCVENGYDIAYGSRYLPGSGSDDDTAVRYLGNKIFTFLMWFLHGVRITDSLFLYIAAKKRVFDKINIKSTDFEYCMEFPIKAHRAGFKYTEIPSWENKRMSGESKVNAFYHGLRILWLLLTV